jgi:hypothetical protein
MKVPIDDYACIDLDAPVLPACETISNGSVRWLVWCDHCDVYHRHGPAEGHREAHCNDSASPYWNTGYNLALAGKWRGRKR